MKREIVCIECAKRRITGYGLVYSENMQAIVDPFPQEHVKMVCGKAKNIFMCDRCGTQINVDDECYASSTWADYGGIPYYEWEDEFITPARESG